MNEDTLRENVTTIFKALKKEKKTSAPKTLFGTLPNGKKIKTFVITEKIVAKKKSIELLAKWRKKSNVWFPAQFKVTYAGTKKWAKEQLLEKEDRILFFLQASGQSEPFGHIGLYRFNFKEKSCEIDNVIRGSQTKGTRGGITVALKLLIDWTLKYLHVKKIFLRVFSDNEKAIALYTRLGFCEVDRVPLYKKVENGIVSWVEEHGKKVKPERYFVTMKYMKKYA